jgi:hypothetical protein
MNRCKDCQHYHPNKGYSHSGSTPIPDALGSCHRWLGGDGSGGYGWSPSEIASNEVVVETDEGWGAQMGPEFGCVLWEPRIAGQ